MGWVVGHPTVSVFKEVYYLLLFSCHIVISGTAQFLFMQDFGFYICYVHLLTIYLDLLFEFPVPLAADWPPPLANLTP